MIQMVSRLRRPRFRDRENLLDAGDSLRAIVACVDQPFGSVNATLYADGNDHPPRNMVLVCLTPLDDPQGTES